MTVFHEMTLHISLQPWTITECCWSTVSGNHVWVKFSFALYVTIKSFIVPAHCFAVCLLLSTNPRLAIIVEVKTKQEKSFTPTKSERRTFVCTIDKGLLLIVGCRCSSPSNTIIHSFRSCFFLISKSVFVSFLCYQNGFSLHNVFGVWRERIGEKLSAESILTFYHRSTLRWADWEQKIHGLVKHYRECRVDVAKKGKLKSYHLTIIYFYHTRNSD